MVGKLLIAAAGFLVSFILMKKLIPKHKRIDTESIAIVREVIDLGRVDGVKAYAVRYEIQSSNPFEILETPVKKARAIGDTRVIYYEEASPKNNYYFKKIGTLDPRFIIPCFFIFGSICAVVGAFLP